MAHLIPVGDTVTAGERRMLQHLRTNLGEDWIILGNPRVHSGAFSREVDAIAIGPRGVWVIDDKGFWGLVTGDRARWVFENGEARGGVLDAIQHASAMASGALVKLGAPFTSIRIAPLVTLSMDFVELRIDDERVDRMVVRLLDSVPRIVGDPDRPAILDADQRAALAAQYSGDAIGARALGQIDQIGRYRLEERLGSDELSSTYLARKDRSADSVELRLYDLTEVSAEFSDRVRRIRAEQEYQALVRLRDVRGVLHMADSYQPVEGYGGELYFFTLDLPGGPTLASRLGDPTWTLPNRMRAARELAATIEEIHRHDVVHRALAPDAIWFWQSDHEFKVGGFHMSRMPGSTLGLSASQFEGNGYAAPEVAADPASATIRSDLYSLAAICWEMLTGRRPFGESPRRPGAELPPMPDELAGVGGLEAIREAIDRLMSVDPVARPASGSALAMALTAAVAIGVDSGHALGPTGHPLPAGAWLGDYRVRQYLGSGGAFHAYLVENAEGTRQRVARVARDPGRLADVVKEFGVLTQLEHPAIVRPIAVNTDVDAAYHMLEEYSGPSTLRDLIGVGPLPARRVAAIGATIASALAYIETRQPPIHHGDVTPSNIAVGVGEAGPKLIDFGLAYLLEPGHVPAAVIGTAPYRPPERDVPGTLWPVSGDLYSLGVVLGELLFGELPYDTHGGQFNKMALNEEFLTHGPGSPALRELIRAAIQPVPTDRLATAAELLRRLSASPELSPHPPVPLERNEIQRLTALLSLNSKGAFNAENRGLDSLFARETYVKTELDIGLLPEILDHRYALVVLTGNPGDGKTAFIQQVLLALDPAAEPLPIHHWTRPDQEGWTFEAVLDGSAADHSRGMSSDEVIDALLDPIEKAGSEQGTGDRSRRVALLAVNDGRLLEYLDGRREDRPSWIVDQLLGQIGEMPVLRHAEVLVVDLNTRSLAHPGESDDVARVIATMLGPEGAGIWSPCVTCRAAAACHVRFNVDTLRSAVGPRVVSRIRELVLLVHSRGRLHVTMRELRSALALVLFGDQTCDEIHSELEALDPGLPALRVERIYWNRAFSAGAAAGRLLGEFADLDPGLEDFPVFDREVLAALASRGDPEAVFNPIATRVPISTDEGGGAAGRGREVFTSLRRRALFEARDELASPGHRSNPLARTSLTHSQTWIELLGVPPEDPAWARLRDRVCRGISLTDDLPEGDLDANLAVRTGGWGSVALTVIRLFPLDEFTIGWERRRGVQRRIGDIPTTLVLCHGPSANPSLEISIDLFELLLRAADGYRLGAEELESVAANLRLFKDRLLALPADEVVLVHPDLGAHRATQRLSNGIRSIAFGDAEE